MSTFAFMYFPLTYDRSARYQGAARRSCALRPVWTISAPRGAAVSSSGNKTIFGYNLLDDRQIKDGFLRIDCVPGIACYCCNKWRFYALFEKGCYDPNKPRFKLSGADHAIDRQFTRDDRSAPKAMTDVLKTIAATGGSRHDRLNFLNSSHVHGFTNAETNFLINKPRFVFRFDMQERHLADAQYPRSN